MFSFSISNLGQSPAYTNAVLSKKGLATNGFNLVFYGVKKISFDTYFYFYSTGLSMGPVRMERVFAL